MSTPSEMNPLATATMAELTDEIKRRSGHGIIVVADYDPKNRDGYGIHAWGSSMWAIGACRLVERQGLQELDAGSTQNPGEPTP